MEKSDFADLKAGTYRGPGLVPRDYRHGDSIEPTGAKPDLHNLHTPDLEPTPRRINVTPGAAMAKLLPNPLQQIAKLIQNLTYRDMRKLASALVDDMPFSIPRETAVAMVAEVLGRAADKLEKDGNVEPRS